MNETTEGLPVPDALELIAKWLREGREIEEASSESPNSWSAVSIGLSFTAISDNSSSYIYRAKPKKPIVGTLSIDNWSYPNMLCIELTPEVKAALDVAGVNYEQ